MGREPFTQVESTGLPIPEADIDTDIIFPARFLLLTAREGLGRYAFHDRRYGEDGAPIVNSVWHQSDKAEAAIIVAGANFGCGSSREQAVWALYGMGIRAIIAPSFGEIFYSNCLRNGLLPVRLADATCAAAMQAASKGSRFTVDLTSQTVHIDSQLIARFEIEPEKKLLLANGWDETDQIIGQFGSEIAQFENHQATVQPWLYSRKTDQ